MKKIILIFLLPIFSAKGQVDSVKGVACGEYINSYLTASGKVYGTSLISGNYQTPVLLRSGIKAVDGMQYQNILLDSSGNVFIVQSNNNTTSQPTVAQVTTDTTGAAFTGNAHIYGAWQAYFTIKSGGVFYGGYGDPLLQNGGNQTQTYRPRQLTQPTGKTITKLGVLTGNNSPGLCELMALCSDGTVFLYTGASTTPSQMTFPGGVATNIAAVGVGCYDILTSTGMYVFGYHGDYLGNPTYPWSSPYDAKPLWVSAGFVFPPKQMSASYNTLSMIDQNDNLFSAGNNMVGEIGNGGEYSPWRTASPPWNYAPGGATILQSPVQIPGKWSNIFGNQNYSFYRIGIGAGGATYFWGRNKARVGAVPNYITGQALSYDATIEGNYSAASIYPAPQKFDIFNTTWNVSHIFDTASAKPPVAAVNIDQYINGSTSTTLNASMSSQQEGSLTGVVWSKLSGPSGGSISSSTSYTPTITGLSNGTYVYQATVTGFGRGGAVASASRATTLYVTGNFNPPTVSAGSNQTVTFPTNFVNLSGTATAFGGTITGLLWTKVSGPDLYFIATPTTLSTVVSGLAVGVYVFRLTATDSNGLQGSGTVQITVNQGVVASSYFISPWILQ